MKAATPDSEYVLLKHVSREKGIAYQTLRDAAGRREFDLLILGRENSRRPHVYVRRADITTWLDQRTQRRAPTSRIHAA